MRLLLSILLLDFCLLSQATFTPSVPAKPAILTIPSTIGSCTITGDAVPAANLIINCTFGSIKDNRTVGPFTTGTALTVQYNAGGHSITIIANAMTLPLNVTGTIDAGVAVGGTF